jgi:S-adenosylmethionine decarboxylase
VRIFGRELSADVLLGAAVLRDDEALRRSLRAGAQAMGCPVLSEHHQRFEPEGLTAVAIIGESHLLVSTYPELGLASFNVQTCSERLRLVEGLEAICAALGAEAVRSLVLLRHLDVPFQVELSREWVSFRAGRLQLDEQPSAFGDDAPLRPAPSFARMV